MRPVIVIAVLASFVAFSVTSICGEPETYDWRIGDEPVWINVPFFPTAAHCDRPSIARVVADGEEAHGRALAPGETDCTIRGSGPDERFSFHVRSIAAKDWPFVVPGEIITMPGCSEEVDAGRRIISVGVDDPIVTSVIPTEGGTVFRVTASDCGSARVQVRIRNDRRPLLFVVRSVDPRFAVPKIGSQACARPCSDPSPDR